MGAGPLCPHEKLPCTPGVQAVTRPWPGCPRAQRCREQLHPASGWVLLPKPSLPPSSLPPSLPPSLLRPLVLLAGTGPALGFRECRASTRSWRCCEDANFRPNAITAKGPGTQGWCWVALGKAKVQKQ